MLVQLMIVRQLVLFIGTGMGAYTDYRTGLIYDKITYPMIFLGVLLNLIELVFGGFTLENAINLFGVGVIVFLGGYVLYITGKLGGGDIKLFTGMAFLLPFQGEFFPLNVFVLQVLFFSAIIAVSLLGIIYTAKYSSIGINWKENLNGIRKAVFLGIVFVIYFAFFNFYPIAPSFRVNFLAIPIVFALLFVAFEKGIKKNFFLEKVSINTLEEGEVIASEFLDEKIKEELNLGFKGVIGEKEKKKLMELNVKEVPVYRNLPRYGPFIFIGTVIALVFPNAIFFLYV